MKNYYDILEVSSDANEQEIKSSYRKLSFKYHPDKNPDDKTAVDTFKEINEAYQTLGDPEKRQVYDLGGSDGQVVFNSGDQINDILRSMGININVDFSGQNPFGRKNNTQKIQVKHQINISLHDAVFGCDVETDVPSYIVCKDCDGVGGKKESCYKCNGVGQTVTFLGTMQYPATCATCNGRGYVLITTCSHCNREGFKKKTKHIKLKIPMGVQNQSALHLSPEPDDKCDLFIIINVLKHPKIQRNGITLFSIEEISCLDAMVGGNINIETIDGEYNLKIPPGTQNGYQLIIEQHGCFIPTGRASHIVSVSIVIPQNLTPLQIKKIEEIKKEFAKN